MIEKYFSRLTLVSLAALAALGTACGDDGNEPPEPPQPKPLEIEVTEVTPTDNMVTFKIITSFEAERVAYWVSEATGEVPSSDELLERGLSGFVGTYTYEVKNLTPETKYRISAVAANTEQVTEVKTVEVTTTPIQYEKIEINGTLGSSYYGNWITDEQGTAQYHLYLTTPPFNEAGQAVGEGIIFQMSMHAAPSQRDNILLAPGTYTASDDCREGTFNTNYSQWTTLDFHGLKTGQGYVNGGEIKVDYDAGTRNYTIEGRVTTVSGQAYEITWEGPIDWWNQVPGGKATQVRGTYNGKTAAFFPEADDPDSDYWVFEFADNFDNGTYVFSVAFFTETVSDFKNPVPADGTYTVNIDQSTVPSSIMPGIQGPNPLLDMGTCMFSRYPTSYITEGTMTLTVKDGEYTIECLCYDDLDHEVELTYSGPIEIKNNYIPPVDRDMEITFDRVSGDEGRYYGEEEHGLHMYQVCLADGDVGDWWSPKPVTPGVEANYLQVTFYSATAPSEAAFMIPAETYTLSKEYLDGVCDPYSTYVYHWDVDGFKQKISFAEGTVLVEHTDAGYHIVLDGTSKEGKSVRTTYDGAIPMHNSSGIPLPARKQAAAHSAAPLLTPEVWQAPRIGEQFDLRRSVLR